jgi:putative flippase GtrA
MAAVMSIPENPIMKLTLLYALFALLAIIVNITTQELSLALYSGANALLYSVIAGTATGLVSKYLLDKAYIFRYQSRHLGDDLTKFTAYTATGIFTTGIFWGFEFGFDYLFGSRLARYTGAVIGLSIGYFIKYRLDKRYVFMPRTD